MISRSSSAGSNELEVVLARRASQRVFYTTGDRVQGDIILHNPNTAFGVQATARFTGSARTKIGARINIHQPTHTSETTLFAFTQNLGTGAKTADATMWSFDFGFPSGTQPTNTRRGRYSADQNFNRNPGHALPPSFRGGPRVDEKDNTIRYTVEAIVSKPYLTHPFPGTLKYDKAIPFRPVRETETCCPAISPSTNTLIISSSYVPVLAISHGDYARWALSRAFEPQNLPIQISTYVPKVLCAGAKLPVSIGLDHDLPQPVAEMLSCVYLRSVVISLENQTRVRAPLQFLGLGQEPQESWSEKTKIADSGPINIPLAEKWDLDELIKDLSISETLLPTFKTFNIARLYVLHITIELECVQQHHKIEVERPLTVLPAICRTEDRSTLISLPRARRRGMTADEPPPPYEEHEGAAGVASGARMGIHRLPSFNTAIEAT